MDEDEIRQLRRLLVLSQRGELDGDAEFRLRTLLGRSDPEAATMSRAWLIRSGMFLLGAHEFMTFVQTRAPDGTVA